MNLTELMFSRRSCRKFTQENISEEDIYELKRVALVAPTSKNCHSTEFIFVTDPQTIDKLANSKDNGASFLHFAPLAVVVCGDANKTDVWIEDASIGATFIQLKAEELGLGSCWVQIRERGFQSSDGVVEKKANDIIKNLLNLPSNLQVECIIGIGKKMANKEPYNDNMLDFSRVHNDEY